MTCEHDVITKCNIVISCQHDTRPNVTHQEMRISEKLQKHSLYPTYVKKCLYICKHTNELLGFEDLNLPEEVFASYETLKAKEITVDSDSDMSEASDCDENHLNKNGDLVAKKLYNFSGAHLKEIYHIQ